MKKDIKADYRRETVSLLKPQKFSDESIAEKMGVASMTVYRWRKGKNTPSAMELLQLREIIEGRSPPKNNIEAIVKAILQEMKNLSDRVSSLEKVRESGGKTRPHGGL